MERETDHRRRDKRKMTPDGMETRSENLGDSGRMDFSRRADRARAPDHTDNTEPVSVLETIARHREQAKRESYSDDTGTPSRDEAPSHDARGPHSLGRDVRSRSHLSDECPGQLRFEDFDGSSSDTQAPVRAAPPHKKSPAPPVAPVADQPKPSRLQFEETAPPPGNPPPSRKLTAARTKADRSALKLEKAKSKLPQRRRINRVKTADARTGRNRTMLRFEKEVKSQRDQLKGPVVTRPIKAGVRSAVGLGHRKIYQVEQENVGVQAAHKGEMLAESGLRALHRSRKLAPYRRVERLGRKTTRLSIRSAWRQTLESNPKLKSNLLSRMIQKKKLKRRYAKAARDAKKSTQRAKKAVTSVVEVAGKVIVAAARHPVAFLIIAGLALLIILLCSMCASLGGIGGSMGGGITGSAYLAEDADVDQAELAYTEWETDLQLKITTVEQDHPDYDEYIYQVGDISHNAFELIAYLTARFQDFTYAGVAAELRSLFDEQYQLTFVESVETRYADPDDQNGDGDLDPFDWRILTVTLTSQPFTNVITGRMDSDQRQHFNILMTTYGLRQHIGSPFTFSWLPYVTSNYGWRVHPITGIKDYHKGVDISVPVGTEILAGHGGTAAVGYDAGGYGNYVTITGKDGLVSKYAHLGSMLVSSGQTVKMGDVIALSGNSGNSTDPHLHLEIIKDNLYLNPLIFAYVGDTDQIPVYGDPGAPMGDGTYEALITEAEKYIGFPYVIC